MLFVFTYLWYSFQFIFFPTLLLDNVIINWFKFPFRKFGKHQKKKEVLSFGFLQVTSSENKNRNSNKNRDNDLQQDLQGAFLLREPTFFLCIEFPSPWRGQEKLYYLKKIYICKTQIEYDDI